MTNSEVIEVLINERDNHINKVKGVSYETRTESINMAIKSLEGIGKIKAEIEKYRSPLCNDGIDVSLKVIDKYITFPNGKWRKEVDNSRRWDRVRFYCSSCGEWQTYGETPYCPYCGCEMEIEEHEE